MIFEKKLIVTGKEVKTKKDGSPFHILHLLMDNGQTCTCTFKGQVDQFLSIQKMGTYNLQLEYVVSQYGNRLDVLGVLNAK